MNNSISDLLLPVPTMPLQCPTIPFPWHWQTQQLKADSTWWDPHKLIGYSMMSCSESLKVELWVRMRFKRWKDHAHISCHFFFLSPCTRAFFFYPFVCPFPLNVNLISAVSFTSCFIFIPELLCALCFWPELSKLFTLWKKTLKPQYFPVVLIVKVKVC